MSSSSPLEIFKSHIVRKVGGKRRDYVKRCITESREGGDTDIRALMEG
jgi:hypothetical protein